jgi:hypothetical protein
MITPNMIVGKGTANQVEISTVEVELEFQRIQLKNITIPSELTKILDLLRIEFRFIVTGVVTAMDESKMINLFNQKGVFTFEYDGIEYQGLFEKLNITNSSRRENPELDVKFTLIRGENLGNV